eukprot:4925863-Pyramimonas_sp.AAC.1
MRSTAIGDRLHQQGERDRAKVFAKKEAQKGTASPVEIRPLANLNELNHFPDLVPLFVTERAVHQGSHRQHASPEGPCSPSA